MKNILLYVVMLGCSFFSLKAATITVDNNEDSSAQYTDLQDAIDDAQDGDTILVSASVTSYSHITINKKLRLIGEGYKENITSLGVVYIQHTNASIGASGTYISGFEISSISFDQEYDGITSAPEMTDIIVERCKLGDITIPMELWVGTTHYLAKYKDISFQNNIFEDNTIKTSNRSSVWFGGFENFKFCNNIFSNTTIQSTVNVSLDSNDDPIISSYVSNSGISFENNIFLYNVNGIFSTVIGMVVENNIFYKAEPIDIDTYQIDEDDSGDIYDSLYVKIYYNNNLQYYSTQDVTATGYFGTGTNNQNADPLFEDYPLEGAAFSFDHDYHLQSSSPAIGAGVNGEDLGIYGGDYPFEVGADPKGPIMTKVEVVGTPSIPQGGSIEINFEAIVQE